MNTERELSRDITEFPKSPEVLNRIHRCQNENLASWLGAKLIQQMGLIEVHEENFEKVSAVKVTPHRQPKRSLENIKTCLEMIWEQ